MAVRVVINRIYTPKQAFGFLSVIDGVDKVLDTCVLELPWKNNERGVSCIPEGVYPVIKHNSPKFGSCLWVREVPNRSEILMHKANYVGSNNPKTGKSDLLGCIAPGSAHTDINGDGLRDIVSSGKTMDRILAVVPDKFDLIIVGLNETHKV